MQKHYFLGLKILDMLVAEFNQPIPGRTLTQHRKMSVSFRDQSLYGIFELALTALRQLRTNQAATAELREEAGHPPLPNLDPRVLQPRWLHCLLDQTLLLHLAMESRWQFDFFLSSEYTASMSI